MNSSNESFDAIIIGAGQAGKPLAMELAGRGQKTVIIERKYVGGTCINYGCTPTKTLLASAHVAHTVRRAAEFGVFTDKPRVDFGKIRQRKDQVVTDFRDGIEKSFRETEHLKLMYGEAHFVDAQTIEVRRRDGGTQRLTAKQIFINAGTNPRKPDMPGIDDVPWLNSTTVMDVSELPSHLLIVGGGYVGLEFGQMFRRFGSEVSIFEHNAHLLKNEDTDVAEAMEKILSDDGIHIHRQADIQRVERASGNGVRLHVKTPDGTQAVNGSHLLVATGTTPNTETLRLSAAGVALDEKGFIQVNERLETTQPGVYAMGDITGAPQFTHASYDDFRILKKNLLDGGNATTRHRRIPYTIFTDPQLGRIGLTENQARQQGYSVRIAKLPVSSIARATETSQTAGLLKAVIDADTDQILGAAILAPEGGEIMSIIQVAMMGQLPYPQLRDAILAHPTWAESLNSLFSKVE